VRKYGGDHNRILRRMDSKQPKLGKTVISLHYNKSTGLLKLQGTRIGVSSISSLIPRNNFNEIVENYLKGGRGGTASALELELPNGKQGKERYGQALSIEKNNAQNNGGGKRKERNTFHDLSKQALPKV